MINSDTNLDTNSDTNSDTNLDTDLVTNLDTNPVIDDSVLQGLSEKQKEVLAYWIIPRSSREILEHIGVANHTKNRDRFVNQLIDKELLVRTIPDSPNSPQQKYVVRKEWKVVRSFGTDSFLKLIRSWIGHVHLIWKLSF